MACPFPQSRNAWLSAGDQKDPHSEFVLSRKLSLEVISTLTVSFRPATLIADILRNMILWQTFLRDLFDKFPSLYQKHSKHVNNFFGVSILAILN